MELKDLKELLELEEEKDTFNLHLIVSQLLKSWKYFAISIPVCLLLAGIYALTLTPEYRVSSAILIKSKDNNSLKGKASFLDDMDMLGGKDNVLDEIQVINSKTLIKRVVTDLNLETTYFLNKHLKEVELYKTSPINVSMTQENLDTLRADIVMNIAFDEHEIVIDGVCDPGFLKKVTFKEKVKSLPAIVQTPMGMIHVTRNPEFPFPTQDMKVVLRRTLTAASILKASLSVELADKKANVITISVPSKNALKGQDILKKLIELYNIASVDEKNQTAINSIKFIDERLGLISGELTTVEKNVENYKQTNKLTDIQAESQEFIKQNSDFEKQRLAVETQINVVDFINTYIRTPENKYGIVPNLGIKDDDLANVLKGYNELLFKRDRLIRTTSDKNPVLIDLERQIQSMRKAIEASIESTKKGLLISKRDMDRQDANLTSRIKAVPRQEREFLEIKRQQEIKAELYTYLLQKREENSLTLAIGLPTARVIEEPLPEDKLISKGASFYLAIALLLGLILPVVFIYLKNQLTGRLTDRQELESLTNVTVLGELPEYNGKEPIVVKTGSREPIAEMYRLLRANIQFILHDKSKKVINVTSTEPGEGKSTFSLNLAITLALTGKKVLLVGLDIRKPTLAEYTKSAHTSGITAYLSGLVPDKNKIIQQTTINEHLYLIQAGAVPPNPNELLLKENLDELFLSLREEFDYIVVDTAPVGMVADTYLLNRLADVNLYIIRANYSKKHNIKLINDISKKEKLKNMYLVMKGSQANDNYYYYGDKKKRKK